MTPHKLSTTLSDFLNPIYFISDHTNGICDFKCYTWILASYCKIFKLRQMCICGTCLRSKFHKFIFCGTFEFIRELHSRSNARKKAQLWELFKFLKITENIVQCALVLLGRLLRQSSLSGLTKKDRRFSPVRKIAR